MRYYARITIVVRRRDGQPMMTWKHPNQDGSISRMKEREYYHLYANTRKELDQIIYKELFYHGGRYDTDKYIVEPYVKIEKKY